MKEKEIIRMNVKTWSLDFALKAHLNLKPATAAGCSLNPIESLISDAKKIEDYCLQHADSAEIVQLRKVKK